MVQPVIGTEALTAVNDTRARLRAVVDLSRKSLKESETESMRVSERENEENKR